MFNWFKKHNHPEFWKSYLALFKNQEPQTFDNCRFVVFDTETTGLAPKTDRMLSIGAIALRKNTLFVSDTFDHFVQQSHFNKKTVAIHGITKNAPGEKLTEQEALEGFINYIGNSVLVAHHAAFDIAMLNAALKRSGLSPLKNKTIDTGILYKKLKNSHQKHLTLEQLCFHFNIPTHDRHTASGDAYLTAILFLKIISRWKKERPVHFKDLFYKKPRIGLL
ncbi:MAG: 3'-5' exonuclease [Flavobacteriaceae bacterium]|nr:3'-5' exonuclease [Flavobacteriaceae bacterium]